MLCASPVSGHTRAPGGGSPCPGAATPGQAPRPHDEVHSAVAMEPEVEVKVDGVVVGWVEYDPEIDRWQARLKGESASERFHFRSRAVAWIRQQHRENQRA